MTDSTSEDANSNAQISKISVRLPPFWPEKPALWFCQLEAQFTLFGISRDATKFWYVVSQLDNKYVQEIEDIVINPPKENKYQKVKEELIKRLSTSQELRIKQLLEHEEIGDRSPSQFLRHLKNLAGDTVPDDLMRTIWISRLPVSSQAILATQKDSALEDVANLADKIFEVNPKPHVVAPVNATRSSEIALLTEKLDRLSRQVEEMSRSRTYFHRDRSNRSHSRHTSRSRKPSQTVKEACWYHQIFGSKAKKCKQPCSFTGNESDH